MTSNSLDNLEESWQRELPDLDTSAMATVARVNRIRALLFRSIEGELKQAGSSLAEFDVLSALRRNGPPYKMKPSAVARATMLSPSGMTHRIDQLEATNLVERVPDPDSRRTAPVALTDHGRATSERLARTLVEVEEQALQSLTSSERRNLDKLLSKLLLNLESSA